MNMIMQKNAIGKKGFSLIDLLVSISIATLVMSVVLFSYRTFQNKLAVGAAAQEIAVATRQAQTLGSTARQSSGAMTSGYGVYFDTVNPKTYYVFVDKNNDCLYSGDATCATGSECVSKNTLRDNVSVTQLCGVDSDGTQSCPPTNATGVSIVYPVSSFQETNQDARICFTDNTGTKVTPSTIYTATKVVTTLHDSLTQTVQSSVSAYQTGRIDVNANLTSVPTTNHPPVLTLVGAASMTVSQSATPFSDPGATAMDTEEGNISGSIVRTGTVNMLVPGTYELTYAVTDSGGMSATPVTRTVTVTVSTPPFISGVNASGFTPDALTLGLSGSGFTPTGNQVIFDGTNVIYTAASSGGTYITVPPMSIPMGQHTVTVVNANGTSNVKPANIIIFDPRFEATVIGQSGPKSARVWTIQVYNGSSNYASNAEVTYFGVNNYDTPGCTPVVLSGPTLSFGDIPVAGYATATATINFSSCTGSAATFYGVGLLGANNSQLIGQTHIVAPTY